MVDRNIFFTSDTHFFHKNIISYCGRPFNDIEEMNEKLIENWNTLVSPNDLVYHLGDFGFANAEKLALIRSRLCGRIFLIQGNHDHGPSKKKWIESIKVDEVYDNFDVSEFHLNHYPRENDCHEIDRYVDKRPIITDRWILCGHIHDKWRIKDKQFNVGVDVNNFRPLHIDEIRKEIYIK